MMWSRTDGIKGARGEKEPRQRIETDGNLKKIDWLRNPAVNRIGFEANPNISSQINIINQLPSSPRPNQPQNPKEL